MEKKRNSSNLLAPSSLFLPSPPIAHLSSAPPPSLPPPTARLLADRLLIPASCAPSYLPPSLPTMPRPSGGQQRAHAAQPRTGACWGQAARPVPVREEGALRPRRAGPLGLRWFRWSSFLRAASTLQVKYLPIRWLLSPVHFPLPLPSPMRIAATVLIRGSNC
ncbi:hypothetical protein SEVIR_1G158301v4 [Setaria viridis]